GWAVLRRLRPRWYALCMSGGHRRAQTGDTPPTLRSRAQGTERTPPMPFHHILLPTDGSDADVEAVQQGLALAAREEATGLLLHVLPSLIPGCEETLLANVNCRLQALARHATVPVQTLVGWGSPGAEICRVAMEHHSDLIAMRTHGRTGLSLVHLGSVA